MLTVMIPCIILLVGLIILRTSCDYEMETIGGVLAFIGGGFLLIFLIVLPINRVTINAKIEQIEVVREEIKSINIKQYNNVQVDRLIVKAIEENQWIRSSRYFKQNLFCSWYIPNIINEIEYIDISKLKDVL